MRALAVVISHWCAFNFMTHSCQSIHPPAVKCVDVFDKAKRHQLTNVSHMDYLFTLLTSACAQELTALSSDSDAKMVTFLGAFYEGGKYIRAVPKCILIILVVCSTFIALEFMNR